MNREIIFRAMRKDNNEWIEGFLIKDTISNSSKNIFYILEFIEEYYDDYLEDYRTSAYYEEVIPETIGQYTGLKDKNGEKIFEHDLVECSWLTKYSSLEVIFTEGSFYLKDIKSKRHFSFSEVIERLKGNIPGEIKKTGYMYYLKQSSSKEAR